MNTMITAAVTLVSAVVVGLVSAQGQFRAGGSYSSPSGGQAQYGNGGGNGLQASASSLSQSRGSASGSSGGDHQGLDWLLESVPGQPGVDYPILAEIPQTSFGCDGQIEGGYYADTDTQCQVFHVCTADGLGGLSKQSFLCPNGTVFNQEYFICDWWFNFDCSDAQGLYSRNDEVQAEREAATLNQGGSSGGGFGSASNNIPFTSGGKPLSSYGSGRK